MLVGPPGQPPPRTGADRTSVVLRLANVPGALVSRAERSSPSGDIDLTRIESRPTRIELGTYVFFLDFASATSTTKPVAEALRGAGHGRCTDSAVSRLLAHRSRCRLPPTRARRGVRVADGAARGAKTMSGSVGAGPARAVVRQRRASRLDTRPPGAELTHRPRAGAGAVTFARDRDQPPGHPGAFDRRPGRARDGRPRSAVELGLCPRSRAERRIHEVQVGAIWRTATTTRPSRTLRCGSTSAGTSGELDLAAARRRDRGTDVLERYRAGRSRELRHALPRRSRLDPRHRRGESRGRDQAGRRRSSAGVDGNFALEHHLANTECSGAERRSPTAGGAACLGCAGAAVLPLEPDRSPRPMDDEAPSARTRWAE